MAMPIKKGYQFHVEYREIPADYRMSSTEVYENYYGIGFLISGDRQVDTPEKTYFVHEGCISPMPIGLYHRSSPLSLRPYKRYGMRFTPLIAGRLIEHIGADAFNQAMSHISYELDKPEQELIIDLFEKMLYEYTHYDEHSEFVMQGMLEHIIITIIRYGRVAETSEAKLNITDEVILKSLAYIDTHYHENPSIEQLSHMAGLSKSHYMKRFRECLGSSYIVYLNHYKIKLGQGLLINTSKSITEIASQLGFCNSNYFTSTFKKICGVTPRAFRLENMDIHMQSLQEPHL